MACQPRENNHPRRPFARVVTMQPVSGAAACRQAAFLANELLARGDKPLDMPEALSLLVVSRTLRFVERELVEPVGNGAGPAYHSVTAQHHSHWCGPPGMIPASWESPSPWRRPQGVPPKRIRENVVVSCQG